MSEAAPLLVIEPDADERARLEAAANELGCEVRGVDPAELGGDPCEDLGEAGALVIAWDLGGRAGLDLLATLRRDPRTAAVPVALCKHAPTRAMVRAALAAGARTFLWAPVSAETLQERLLVYAAEPEATDAPDPDASAGGEDAAAADEQDVS